MPVASFPLPGGLGRAWLRAWAWPVVEAIATIASWAVPSLKLRQASRAFAKSYGRQAGGPRMPDQGWTLRAQTHCQAKHRLMPCSGILEQNTGIGLRSKYPFQNLES